MSRLEQVPDLGWNIKENKLFHHTEELVITELKGANNRNEVLSTNDQGQVISVEAQPGPQGEPGPQGDQGPQGNQGEIGPPGPMMEQVPKEFYTQQIYGDGSWSPGDGSDHWSVGGDGFQTNLKIHNVAEFTSHTFFTGSQGARGFKNSAFFLNNISIGGRGWSHSDDRLKHNEIDISNGLDVIRKLKPKVYDRSWELNEQDSSKYFKEVGLIAQDVLLINDLSHAVAYGDYTDENGEIQEAPYSLNYRDIHTYTIAAVKELDKELQALKAENAIMKAALNELLISAGKSII